MFVEKTEAKIMDCGAVPRLTPPVSYFFIQFIFLQTCDTSGIGKGKDGAHDLRDFLNMYFSNAIPNKIHRMAT